MAKQNIKINGKLELIIDPLEIKATLNFKKNLSKETWDLDSISKLILVNDIGVPISKSTLEKNILTWSKLPGEEFNLVIATGIPPEKTIHETIEWKNCDIPEDLIEKGEELFSNTPIPEIYNVIKEKVKTEKYQKQKALLPFMHGKEEKVSIWETVEKRIPVKIDPTLKYKGFVHKGDIIAKIIPGKTGKPGRNIHEKPIAPEKIKKAEFYPGSGVIKNLFELKALEDGFLRCGENWADIIPYKIQSLKVYKSPDNKSCLLDFTPDPVKIAFPDLELIYEKAEALGFSGIELLKKAELQKILEQAIARQVPIERKLLNAKNDAIIDILITPDKLKAVLNLVKANSKGKELDLKELGRKINQLAVKGINKQKLQHDILDFHHSNERILKDYTLIEGKAPVRGKDGELNFECRFLPLKEKNEFLVKLKNNYKRTKLESEKKFPITGINELANTEKNKKIAGIIPPSYGSPGVDIYGNELPPIRGNDPDITIYENIIISKNDLIATADGLLEIGKSDSTTLLRIRETQDARIDIKVSESRIKVFLTLHPVKGIGKALEIADINQELRKAGIIKGIMQDKFPELLLKVQRGELVKEELIAMAVPPVHGTGRRLLFHVKIATGNPMELGNEPTKPDYGTGLYIKKDSIIAEIFPPAILPKDGWDVTGNVLTANTGMEIAIQAGKNIKTIKETSGVIKFIAGSDGEVFYNGNILEIKDQQVIPGDVGADKGVISVPGSLKIEGSILPGAKVFSKGNITVSKNIKEAIVSSEGTLYAGNEIIGNNRTALRSKSDICFNKAENTILLAVGNIIIKNHCLNSIIKCNGRILYDAANGTLAGGVIKARKGMDLVDLGSKAQIKTCLSFGQDYLIRDQIEIEEKEIQKLNKQITIYDAQANNTDITVKEKLFRIHKAKRIAIKTLEKRNSRLFMLREKYEEHFPSEIIIKGKVYPGVIIESHDRIYEVRTEKSKVIFSFNTENGKIEEIPLKSS